ncbi:Transcriptional regulator [Malassezia nana]|uniref:Transcriptional regulator n=1 Tax=Malassezia nana TaxID=180528 RepID=A0AAF0J3E9_9BASI|nr:Transcriptional regulator [Malassezia nana]
MPAAGVPATFRSSAVPLWRKYTGTVGTSSNAIPSLDELSALAQHLQVLQQDAEARARTLADERPAKARAARAKARDMKSESDAFVPETSSPAKSESGSDAEWAPDDVRRRASAGRTYGRGKARRKANDAPVPASQTTEVLSESDSEMALSLQRTKTQRPPLGIKLRLTQPGDTRAVRPELRPVPVPETATDGIDLHGDAFYDTTTFSWDVPPELEGSILPKCEPIRLPKPYPTHPDDVNEDFSERDWRERDSVYSVGESSEAAAVPKDAGRSRPTKEASQVPATTFFHFADAYFKPVTEEDLAWLSSRADDPSPFHFPELGPHYRTVWEKEDAELLGVLRAMDGKGASAPAPQPPTQRATELLLPSSASLNALTDADMYSRTLCGGPLMERLASSLLLPEDGAQEPTSQAMQSSHSNSSHASNSSDDVDGACGPPPDPHKPLADMEAQARQACEAIGLLEPGVPVPWDDHADGPIASALRLAQEKLRRQVRSNEQRKARLFQVAKDCMAYQDYMACLQAAEREIEASWTKRTRQLKASAGKKRKSEPDAGPSRPPLPDALPEALQRRKRLKAAFEPLFAKIPHACFPPTQSIYHGID